MFLCRFCRQWESRRGNRLPILSRTVWLMPSGPALLWRFFCTRHPKRQVFFLLTGFVLFFASIESTLLARDNEKESLKEMFRYVKLKQAEGYKIYLLNPQERTSGAVYFYLHKNLPARNPEEYDGVSKELWIMRRKEEKKTALCESSQIF